MMKIATYWADGGIGTTEILLNVVYKVETWSSDSFQPYVSKYLGFGVQKRSKIALRSGNSGK